MTEAELRTMIDEGKSLDEIASEMAAGEYDVCSRETLLSYAISEIETLIVFCLNIKSQHTPVRSLSFCILSTALLVVLSIRSLQGELFITDTQYMVAAGRWIIANGHLPTTDPLTIHSELAYICQQYPICILVAVLYDTFGEMSVRLFFALLNMVAVLFIWYITFPKAGNRLLHCAVSCVFGAIIVYSLRSTPRALDILCLAVS